MAEGEYIIVYEKSYDEMCERGERGVWIETEVNI
jgi:hypothetical protein